MFSTKDDPLGGVDFSLARLKRGAPGQTQTLEASFQELCHSRLPLLHLNRGRNESAASASRLDEECAPVRALYGKDVALWRAHCGTELEPRTVAV